MKSNSVYARFKKQGLGLLFATLTHFVVFASTITPTTDCDTLISKEGRVILVEIVSVTDSTIRFRACEAWENGLIMEQPLSTIQEIRRSPQSVDLVVLSSTEEKKVQVFTTLSVLFGIGPIVFWLLTLVIPIGTPLLVFAGMVPLVILGLIFSSKVLKMTKQSKLKHKKHRRLALLGLAGSLLQAITYLVAFLFLFIVIIFIRNFELFNDIE